jgi:pyrroloquinoline quinone (PQQ) biosynthesis protein C
MEADVYHAQTSRELLNGLCSSGEKAAAAEVATQRTLDALYGFLDSVTARNAG